MQLDKLQKLYNEHKIKWSTHCLTRMQERDISIEDVDNCINSGEIIEDYPNTDKFEDDLKTRKEK